MPKIYDVDFVIFISINLLVDWPTASIYNTFNSSEIPTKHKIPNSKH